jgi:hypothetical protein
MSRFHIQYPDAPPTEAQLQAMERLGYRGPEAQTRMQAHHILNVMTRKPFPKSPDNPRALGTNPRARGVNPRAGGSSHATTVRSTEV